MLIVNSIQHACILLAPVITGVRDKLTGVCSIFRRQTSLRLARLIFSGFALFALVLERAKLRSSRLQDVAAVCGAAKLGAHVSN